MEIEQKRAYRRKKLGTDVQADEVTQVAQQTQIVREQENPVQVVSSIGQSHMGWVLTNNGWECKE